MGDLTNSATDEFFAAAGELTARGGFVLDRPGGSFHPRHQEILYPVDYGHLTGTVSGDGDGIDVFRGECEGVGVVGIFVTVDLVKKDSEIKIVLDCSDGEVASIHELFETMRLAHIYIPRG